MCSLLFFVQQFGHLFSLSDFRRAGLSVKAALEDKTEKMKRTQKAVDVLHKVLTDEVSRTVLGG